MTMGMVRRAGRMLGGTGRNGTGRSSDRPADRPEDAGSADARTNRSAPAETGSSMRSATRSAGDPTQSAAAQRQSSRHFRLADAGDRLSSTRAESRYKAAAQAPRDAAGRLPEHARREQALMRATLMRQRAGELRAQGDTTSADMLMSKARLQNRFGRGDAIARPARFTPEQRVTRRQVFRQALTEVGGMHALERDVLTHRIDADEQRLPTLQRDLAMAGSTGGNTAALHQEHTELTQRLAASRTRLAALTPLEGQQFPRATREAATALANERLPQQLRSTPYAMRHGAAKGSAFVQRIAQAGTQGGRDELARARATGARMAATPADKRPPIAPLRKRGTADRSRRDQASGGDVEHPADRSAARRSRAPSSTIARLRQRQIDAARNPPLPRDDQETE